MLLAVLAITVLGIGIGLLLGLAGKIFAVKEENPMVNSILDMLPGSQCGQCGFAGCSPAAKAVVDGEVGLNFCPPGGRAVVDHIAELLGIDPGNIGEVADPLLAHIDDEQCVGCTRCLKACPTDAIVGANGQIHSVIVDACTGCKKCLQTCPEDCISMSSEPGSLRSWHWPKPEAA